MFATWNFFQRLSERFRFAAIINHYAISYAVHNFYVENVHPILYIQ